jgi:predicted amidohydrolase
MLDDAASLRPDLICLPECFAEHSGDNPVRSEDMSAEALDALSGYAKKIGSYIVAGSYERQGDSKYNVGWIIGRKGELIGRYLKNHPVDTEIKNKHVLSGTEIPVFDLDFGRVGVAICFDIGWPDVWRVLGEKGAELVVWPSMYDGGFPLLSYAWTYGYYIISSSWDNHSRIIDKTGRVLHSTSFWQGWAYGAVDLEKEFFHVGSCGHKDETIRKFLRKYGRGVTIESLTEESYFTLESNDSDVTVPMIKEEFGMVNFFDFHKRQGDFQLKHTYGGYTGRRFFYLVHVLKIPCSS